MFNYHLLTKITAVSVLSYSEMERHPWFHLHIVFWNSPNVEVQKTITPLPVCFQTSKWRSNFQYKHSRTLLREEKHGRILVLGIFTRHAFAWNDRPHKWRSTVKACVQIEGTWVLYWGVAVEILDYVEVLE